MEKCANCGRNINDTEKVYAYQGKNVVCGKCYILLIEKEKQTKEKPLPGTLISSIWEVLGAICGITTFVSLLIGLEKKYEYEGWEILKLMIFSLLASILAGLIPFTTSAIIKAINANTLELRKLKEEIKLNRKNEKTGDL